jgi:hypothetical protein
VRAQAEVLEKVAGVQVGLVEAGAHIAHKAEEEDLARLLSIKVTHQRFIIITSSMDIVIMRLGH